MKKLRIGRRRAQVRPSSPLELALAPALEDGSWRVPDRFNLTRDLVEVLGRHGNRQALTILGQDGIVEPRTFKQLAAGAGRWASILRSKDVGQGDRVVVLSRLNEDWVEIALGCIKIGAVFVPASPTISPQALEARVAVTDAALVVAGEESEEAIARMSFTPDVHHVRSGRMRRSSDAPPNEPTAETPSRDIAYLTWTAGTEAAPKPVAHTHGSLFAARAQAEHWLDVREGDLVWCAAGPGSALAISTTLAGPWTRGAEVVVHEGDFDPIERLDLIRRVGPTVLCQSPAEYEAMMGLRHLARSRPPRLRRLLATGDYLGPEVLQAFESAWGLTIHAGYGETETGVVTVTAPTEDDAPRLPGEIGAPLPGHHLAVVDDQGSELPAGVEGRLAVRGRPPTLFVGYWEAPEETKHAFRGDWYLTGDVAVAGERGLRFLARADELITTRGRTFGPHEVERALAAHEAVVTSAVVGVRDLERGGQFVRAFVVLKDGVEGTEQLEAELRQYVGESVAEQQVPREIEFVDGLPRSASGAVRRPELRDRPMSGRPLWEAPPTSEPEPEPPLTAELIVSTEPEPFELDVPVLELEPAEPVAFVEPVVDETWVEPQPPAAEPSALVETEPSEEMPGPEDAEPETTPSGEAPFEAADEPAPEAARVVEQPESIVAPVEEPPAADEPGVISAPHDEAVTGMPDAEVVDLAPTSAPPAPDPAPTVEAEPVEAVLEEPPGVETGHSAMPAALDAGTTPRHLPEFPEIVELAQEEPLGTDEPQQEQEPEPEPQPAAPVPLLRSEAASAQTVEPVVRPEPPEPLAETALEPDPATEPAAAAAESDEAPAPAASPPPEPLPEYIVSPADAYASIPAKPVEIAPEPEDEEDLGPLPEYIVDPERRLEVVADAPSPAPAAEAPPPVDPALEDHPLAGLARPHVSIPIPADDDPKKSRPGRRSRGRVRPAPSSDETRKRDRSTGEPGDEGLETGWMQRLSNRLDAYGMSTEGQEQPEDGESAGKDAGGAPKK